MAQPWKDPITGVLHLRQRTPSDLVGKVKGSSILLPIADAMVPIKIGDVVQASLRTKEPGEAKARHAVADAALRKYWERTRKFGTQLSHKQAVALAGDFYRMMISKIEDVPHISHHAISEATTRQRLRAAVGKLGFDPEQMEMLATAVGAASLPAELLVQAPDADERYPDALEATLGDMADAYLSEEHLVLDVASRNMLIRELWRAWRLVLRRAERLSDGDYGQDANLARFPERENVDSENNGTSTLDMVGLFDSWCEKKAAILAPATIDRYGPSVRSFAAFVGRKCISKITSTDVYKWAEKRRDEDGVNAKTVNKNDLAAVRSVLRWATRHQGGLILSENVAQRVQLDVPNGEKGRPKYFRPDEVVRVLRAANKATNRENDPKLLAAKRWCPWIMAYSGARVSECTSIRGVDVRQEGEVWLIDLVRTKGNKPRQVPIHDHLIEMGFLDFVQESGPEPLFYDVSGAATKTHPASLRAEYLARWIREAAGLDDLGVAPNHAWRHTFKLGLLKQGVMERVSDEITGHAPKGVARAYEAPTIEMMAEAIKKFPRYRP